MDGSWWEIERNWSKKPPARSGLEKRLLSQTHVHLNDTIVVNVFSMGEEMDMAWALPQVDENLCTLCGLCVEACPCQAVKLEEERLVFTCQTACRCDDVEACNCWNLCEEICPTGAITCAFEIVRDNV
jgi:ferredoxin